jgi:hypothetical protein
VVCCRRDPLVVHYHVHWCASWWCILLLLLLLLIIIIIRYWSELHTPGTPAPFKVRSSSYLEDRTKVNGGIPQFVLGSVDLVETPGPVQHISRYLPAVR